MKPNLNTMSTKELIEHLMIGFGGDELKAIIEEVELKWESTYKKKTEKKAMQNESESKTYVN